MSDYAIWNEVHYWDTKLSCAFYFDTVFPISDKKFSESGTSHQHFKGPTSQGKNATSTNLIT